MKSPFTNLGSNIDADDHRSQAVDRAREADEFIAEHGRFENYTLRAFPRLEKSGVLPAASQPDGAE